MPLPTQSATTQNYVPRLRWGQGLGDGARGNWMENAGGGTRTRKGSLPEVFETSASATSATPAT